MKLGYLYVFFLLLVVYLFVDHARADAPNLLPSGMAVVNQSGYNTAISPTDDVWSQDGQYAFLSSRSILTAAASNAVDSSGSVYGCATVRVEGLDVDFNYQTEDLTLLGGTPVPTANYYRRVNKLSCLTAGTLGTNSTAITISSAAVVYAAIPAGIGRSQMAIFSGAANRQSYLAGYDFSCGASSTCQAAVSIEMREFGGAWQTVDVASGSDSAGIISKLFGAWQLIPKKGDIRMRAVSVGSGGYRVNGSLQINQQP